MARATIVCNPCVSCRSRECEKPDGTFCPCRTCSKTIEARQEEGCPKNKAS